MKEELILELQNKYESLVWYARVRPENLEVEGVKEKMEEIEKLYPIEVNELQTDQGTWLHGFHSGALGILRYLLDVDEMGKETADKWFPNLDT